MAGTSLDLSMFMMVLEYFHFLKDEYIKFGFFALMLDCDGDDLISKADVFQFFQKSIGEESNGLGKKMAFIENEFEGMDNDNDGLVSVQDFCAKISEKAKITIKEILTVDFF